MKDARRRLLGVTSVISLSTGSISLAQITGTGDAVVPIFNGSFEVDPIITNDYALANPPSGWSAFNSSGAYLMNATKGRFPRGMPDGQAISLLVHRGSQYNVLYQSLPSVTFAPNTTYTLSGYQGFPDKSPDDMEDRFNAGGKLELFGSADNYSQPVISLVFPPNSAAVGSFQFKSGTFTTGSSGGAIGGIALVRIEAADGSTTLDSYSSWDDIQLTAATLVPLTNASFASPAIITGDSQTVSLASFPGWTAFNSGPNDYTVVKDNGAAPDDPTKRFPQGIPNSGQALTVRVPHGSHFNVAYQSPGHTFQPNTTYTLSGYQGFDKTLEGLGFNGGGKLELYSSSDNYRTPLITLDFPPGAPSGRFHFNADSFTTAASGGAVGGAALIRIQSYDADPQQVQDSYASWNDIRLASTPAASIGRAHQALLARGLQLGAFDGLGRNITVPSVSGWLSTWASSNFTTINFINDDQYHGWLLGQMPGQLWARWGSQDLIWPENNGEEAFAGNLFSIQYLDEFSDRPKIGPEVYGPAPFTFSTLNKYSNAFNVWRGSLPNTLVFTNAAGQQLTSAQLRTFMQTTRPDLLSYDFYPHQWANACIDGSQPIPITREQIYDELQKYRTVALGGNSRDGSQPLPFAHALQAFSPCEYEDEFMTESFVRQQQFSGWTFGTAMATAWLYEDWNRGEDDLPPNCPPEMENPPGDPPMCQPTGNYAQMFDQYNVATPVHGYFATTNSMSRNLGPALVRLKSTHVRIVPGKVSGARNLDVPTVGNWARGADPYIVSIAPRGKDNTVSPTSYCDWLVGYFLPLRADNSDYPFANGLHFMITNGNGGLMNHGEQSPTGSAGSAANQAEWVRIQFDFSGSGFNSLERLSRTTGQVEIVNQSTQGWTSLGNDQYQLDLQLDGGTGDLFRFATH